VHSPRNGLGLRAAALLAALLATSGRAHADAPVSHLSAGGYHTCAVKSTGTLWCWGFNGAGQIGDGTTTDKHFPWQVNAFGNSAVEVAAGFDHTCARKNDGTLWCWGINTGGEVGDGTGVNQSLPVQLTTLGNTVTNVSAGDEHTCARQSNGSVWCWGRDTFGELGDGGNTSQAAPVLVGGGFADVSAGGYHTCARKADGTLWCWGENNVGQVGDGTTTDRNVPVQVTALGAAVAEVSAGEDHTCARKTDGTLWCWGWNFHGQLGDGTEVDESTPVQVEALGNTVAQVSTGRDFTCARKTDFSLWCWGYNAYGELGDGTQLKRQVPFRVTTLGSSVFDVSAGQYFTCSNNYYGEIWCWGSNLSGQLGNGSLDDSVTPVQVPGFLPAPQVPATGPYGKAALALLLAGIAVLAKTRRREPMKHLG
jgi:alpha-tubulin suppressor-like RCC1 family protein